MKIIRAVNVRESVVVETDMGKIILFGKIYVLAAGVACAKWVRGPYFPKVRIPAFGDYSDQNLAGTSDPVLVCLARRGFTQRDTEKYLTELTVPDENEALEENHSGQDMFGGTWPAPRV